MKEAYFENGLGKKVPPNSNGRRLVVGDIHGCPKTLAALLEDKVKLRPSDMLFFVGDYIDRGPDSAGVIDYILALMEKHEAVFPLLGNHEKNILDAENEYDAATFAWFVQRKNKSHNLLTPDLKLKTKYRNFFRKLPYFYDTGTVLIVHAGFDFAASQPFSAYTAMLELRRVLPLPPEHGWRRIVHGHQPTPIQQIQKAVQQRAAVIPLDNGCVYNKPHKVYDYKELGNLCCLNIDTFELYSQKNIDSEPLVFA